MVVERVYDRFPRFAVWHRGKHKNPRLTHWAAIIPTCGHCFAKCMRFRGLGGELPKATDSVIFTGEAIDNSSSWQNGQKCYG